MSLIEIESVTKYYGNFLAVDNVSLRVSKNQIYGIVGKNGAGKSTLINILTKSLYPSNGNLKISKNVSYVPSDPIFFKNLTVKELIEFQISINKPTEDYEKLCNYFEIDITKKTEELSLGNKKKLAIVLAFLKKSDVIILDEPTNGLDPLMQKRLFKKLLEIKKNKAIFLSSHNLEDVEKYCDIVSIFKNGKIEKEINLEENLEDVYEFTYKINKEDEKKIKTTNINEVLKKLSKENITSLNVKNIGISEKFEKIYGDKNE